MKGNGIVQFLHKSRLSSAGFLSSAADASSTCRTVAPSNQLPATMWMQEDIATIFRRQRRRHQDKQANLRSNDDGDDEVMSKDSEHLRPKPAVYERRPESTAAIPKNSGRRYYYAGLYGGTTAEFLTLSRAVARRTEADLARGIIAQVKLRADAGYNNGYVFIVVF